METVHRNQMVRRCLQEVIRHLTLGRSMFPIFSCLTYSFKSSLSISLTEHCEEGDEGLPLSLKVASFPEWVVCAFRHRSLAL
jgi:hypothetical protein